MDEREILMIPFHSHEMDMDRAERANKRLWVVIIILIVTLIGTNAGWLFYESQFASEVISQEVDTGDGMAIVSGTGDAIYGEGKANDQTQSP